MFIIESILFVVESDTFVVALFSCDPCFVPFIFYYSFAVDYLVFTGEGGCICETVASFDAASAFSSPSIP